MIAWQPGWTARLWRRRLLAVPRMDWPLLGGLLALAGIGLAVLYSASDGDTGTVLRQSARLGAGFLGLWLLSRFPVQTLRVWSPLFYLASLSMLLLLFGFGVVTQGAQRWLDLGLFRFQPAELLKLSLPMMLAWQMHQGPLPPRWGATLACVVLIGVPVGLITWQPDLGTALLVGASGAFVLFLAGMRWHVMAALLGIAAVAAPLAWRFAMHDYQRQRLMTFFSPEADPLGSGWNIIQSKIAVGSGGLFGKGWLNGTQSHLEFLPERSTDFILAVLAEEFGLLGVLALLGIYLFIIGRGLLIAMQARDTYSRLLAGSLTLAFSLYVLVNTSMVSGLLPVVGIPLPLVSYGGTSAVTVLAGFGMLTAIANDRRPLRS